MAMRYLNAGQRYEDVSIVLGDTIATIEKHYSELIFTQANKLAFEKAHPRYRREKAIETAQPEWLEREVGFRTSTRRYGAVHRTGVLDADYMVDAGESSRSVLVAIQALLHAGRLDSALSIIEAEIGGGY